MDIKKIIKEETGNWMNEVTMTREPFNYRKQSDGQYYIDVVVPEKNINTVFTVSFSPTGYNGEKGYSISFKERGGDYSDDTNMGIPFRILATITRVVQEFAKEKDPDVFNFQPVRTSGDKRGGQQNNRRLKLYANYVKQGAGDKYDGFIVGDNFMMTVEKRNPSFELVNGYQEPEIIQNIVKELTIYQGRYETTDVPRNDPDYRIFSVANYGGFFTSDGSGNSTRTVSARRFVDWLFSEPNVGYVQGIHEPEPYDVPQPQQGDEPVDAPIQRIGGRQFSAAEIGSFQHFLNNNVYGYPDYTELQPFFDSIKTIEKFEELKSKSERQILNTDDNERERLEGIIDAVNKLKQAYEQYERLHENSDLNEIENNLLDLLS